MTQLNLLVEGIDVFIHQPTDSSLENWESLDLPNSTFHITIYLFTILQF
jgi:hypothetical protein